MLSEDHLTVLHTLRSYKRQRFRGSSTIHIQEFQAAVQNAADLISGPVTGRFTQEIAGKWHRQTVAAMGMHLPNDLLGGSRDFRAKL
jgi:hypothetical protein